MLSSHLSNLPFGLLIFFDVFSCSSTYPPFSPVEFETCLIITREETGMINGLQSCQFSKCALGWTSIIGVALAAEW